MSNGSKANRAVSGSFASLNSGKSDNRSVARDSGNLGLPKIDALFLLGVARKHWKWIVPVALLLSGLGAALVLAFFKPVYEAKLIFQYEFCDITIHFGESQVWIGRFYLPRNTINAMFNLLQDK
jgi:hypothetical protein